MITKQFNILLVLASLLYLPMVNAQNDSIKKARKKVKRFRAIVDAPRIGEGFVIGKEEEKTISPIFSLKEKNSEPLKGFDYYLNLGASKQKNNLRSMSSQSNVDSDVLVKRSFNGQDTSVKNIESHASLGTVESSTKFVRIEFADHGLVDGDRVRIYLNERIVEENIMLTGISAFIQLKMEPGYNRIDFSALNQGLVGPNTAAFMVYDDKGKLVTAKAWNLRKNQNATLGIIRNSNE